MRIATWLTHRQVAEWSLSDAQAARLAAAAPGATVARCADEAGFVAALADAEVALTWRFRQEWFAAAPRLRLLGTPAAGREYLPVTPPRGVELRFGAFHGAIMAETVLAWMLGFCRGTALHATAMRAPQGADWPRERFSGHVRCLRGARVTILGYGHIGSWVARLAQALGAEVTGVARTARPGTTPPVLGHAALDALLPRTDHLVAVLPQTPETDRMLDARRLALLPPGAFLYNVGRGNAIDEMALAAALAAGRLAGAALDVFAVEPLPHDSPLRSAPNCLLYPHVAAIAPEYLDLYLEEAAAACRALARSSAP